jgi:hypothetical protein
VAATYAFVHGLLVPRAQLAFTPWGLVLFGAALSATERLAQQHDITMDRNWLGLVQSCLLSIELRMRELLALLR